MALPDLSRCALHTVTTAPWSLEQCIDGCHRAGINALTVWKEAVAPLGARRAGELLRAAGMRVPALCGGGGFPAFSADDRQAALDVNRRLIDDAATLGAEMLVLVCGAVPGMPLGEARRQIAEGIAAIAPHACASGVSLAIEPQHPTYAGDRSAITTMRQARAICEQMPWRGRDGYPVVGLVADVYHVWWDDRLEDEIAIAGAKGYLQGFHVSDWKLDQRHQLNDRGLMGEGCIDIPTIRGWVERAGFSGFNEVEITSERWWGMDQAAWVERIVAAYLAKV
jgi:sugar phosphate isomerase/epimerase